MEHPVRALLSLRRVREMEEERAIEEEHKKRQELATREARVEAAERRVREHRDDTTRVQAEEHARKHGGFRATEAMLEGAYVAQRAMEAHAIARSLAELVSARDAEQVLHAEAAEARRRASQRVKLVERLTDRKRTEARLEATRREEAILDECTVRKGP